MDRMQPINVTSATLTLTKEAHSGTVITVNRAAGSTLTLPASAGDGSIFEIFVGTTITSNSLIVQVANSSDIMSGVAWQAADGGSTSNAWETGASDDTITMDGSTKGGIKGDRIILKDVSANVWAVSIFGAASGTEASPFSAAV
jgi:co-chaperonin GroES (HSP10)